MNGWLVLLLLLAIGGGAAGWWWKTHPHTRCGWCRGSGKNPLSTEKRFGKCRHCDGSGRKEWKV